MKTIAIIAAIIFIASAVWGMQHGHRAGDTKIDCVINAGPCIRTVEMDNIQVVFDISPKPVTAMKELLFTITLRKGEKPVTDAKVTVDLTMPGMFMGVNRPALTHTKEGRYEGMGIIARCPSGGKVWEAKVVIERMNRSASVSYIFEVER